MPTSPSLRRRLPLNLIIAGSLLTVAAATWTAAGREALAQPGKHKMTADDVARIEQALKGTDPSTYHLVLPLFRAGKVVGSRTYGTLSLARVRLVASARRVVLSEQGNLQLVMGPDEAGMASGERSNDTNDAKTDTKTDGGGANSHHTTSTKRLELMLEEIVRNIDTDQYVFLKAEAGQLKTRAVPTPATKLAPRP